MHITESVDIFYVYGFGYVHILYLARWANLPDGLYILLALISSFFIFFYNEQCYPVSYTHLTLPTILRV